MSFSKNLRDYSKENSERFHQAIKEMERRYENYWEVSIMADYCWMLYKKTVAIHNDGFLPQNRNIVYHIHFLFVLVVYNID